MCHCRGIHIRQSPNTYEKKDIDPIKFHLDKGVGAGYSNTLLIVRNDEFKQHWYPVIIQNSDSRVHWIFQASPLRIHCGLADFSFPPVPSNRVTDSLLYTSKRPAASTVTANRVYGTTRFVSAATLAST